MKSNASASRLALFACVNAAFGILGAPGCASADSSPDDETTSAEVRSTPLSLPRVAVVSTSLQVLSARATEDEAVDDARRFLEVTKRFSRRDCAQTLGIAEGLVQDRIDGCRAFATRETRTNGLTTFVPSVECDLGICAAEDLSTSEIVRFDGSGSLSTISGTPLTPGSKVVLIADLARLSTFVSTESLEEASVNRGVAALVPHLHVRTDGGRFNEVANIPSLPHARGNAIDLLGYRRGEALPARLITIPQGADRLEIYIRFERFHYHQTNEPVHDTVPPRRIDGQASDGYVSNFGKNFSLPVQ